MYAGSKGYAVTFTRTLAAELTDAPVRVQVVCPGLTATEFHLGAGGTRWAVSAGSTTRAACRRRTW